MTATKAAVARRWKEIKDRPLLPGSHNPDGEMCVMEAISFVAGEPWSDHPQCVCPVLSAFIRQWNDDMNDQDRQLLKPYVPRLVGTRSTPEVEQRRGWMLADWMVRVHTPAWLELGGMTEQANALRALPELVDPASFDKSQPALNEAKEKAEAAGAAAGAAAWAAAWAAAGAAAGEASSKKLEPTKVTLQDSALELLDRLIACN